MHPQVPQRFSDREPLLSRYTAVLRSNRNAFTSKKPTCTCRSVFHAGLQSLVSDGNAVCVYMYMYVFGYINIFFLIFILVTACSCKKFVHVDIHAKCTSCIDTAQIQLRLGILISKLHVHVQYNYTILLHFAVYHCRN